MERNTAFAIGVALAAMSCAGRVENGNGNSNDGPPLSCEAQSSAAGEKISAALDAASADLSCVSDGDCALASPGSSCTPSCGPIVTSIRGQALVLAAVDDVDHGVCSGFEAQGCLVSEPPCIGVMNGSACLNGTCTNFLPQAWSSLAIYQGTGESAGYVGTPPTCDVGQSCTLWTITPDGEIQKSMNGTLAIIRPTAADFATIDTIVRGVSFRQIFASLSDVAPALTCAPAPPGIIVALDLQSSGGGMVGVDETGCALTGPSGNDVQRLYNLVSTY